MQQCWWFTILTPNSSLLFGFNFVGLQIADVCITFWFLISSDKTDWSECCRAWQHPLCSSEGSVCESGNILSQWDFEAEPRNLLWHPSSVFILTYSNVNLTKALEVFAVFYSFFTLKEEEDRLRVHGSSSCLPLTPPASPPLPARGWIIRQVYRSPHCLHTAPTWLWYIWERLSIVDAAQLSGGWPFSMD